MLLMRRDFTTDCVLSAAGLDFEFRLLVALQYKPSESDQCFDTTKLFITTAVTSTTKPATSPICATFASFPRTRLLRFQHLHDLMSLHETSQMRPQKKNTRLLIGLLFPLVSKDSMKAGGKASRELRFSGFRFRPNPLSCYLS